MSSVKNFVVIASVVGAVLYGSYAAINWRVESVQAAIAEKNDPQTIMQKEWTENKTAILEKANQAPTAIEARSILLPYKSFFDTETMKVLNQYEFILVKDEIFDNSKALSVRIEACNNASKINIIDVNTNNVCKTLSDSLKKMKSMPYDELCNGAKKAGNNNTITTSFSSKPKWLDYVDELNARDKTDYYRTLMMLKGSAYIGMSRDAAICAWGRPKYVNRSIYSFGVHEQWVYRSNNYLYFKDGVLTTIQN